MSYLARLKDLRGQAEGGAKSDKSPSGTFGTALGARVSTFSAAELPADSPHCGACNWSPSDWRCDYQERLGIVSEHERILSDDALQVALTHSLRGFMRMHLPEPAGDACLFCGVANGKLHPFIRRGQAAHAHDACWTAFRLEAETALKRMGVLP